MSEVKTINLAKMSFNEVMQQFEAAVAEFDAADLDVEQALAAYEKANSLLKELEARLATTKSKVEVVLKASE
ncbi:MAG TPA: exodeoxyribonuclease VII small subunit [Candidatus Saccharimonadales bacterium]